MNRKSQFYLFGALLLISLVYAATSNKSEISTSKIDNSQEFFNNYIYEAKIIINNAIYSNKNISYELRNFTEYFISYGDYKDTSFGILYSYSFNNNLYIVNYLNQSILISTLGITIIPGQEIVTEFKNNIVLNYFDEKYYFNFSSPYDIELKTLWVQDD